MTHFRLGRVLRSGGAAEDALTPLREARRRFQQLAATGNESADRMAGVTLAEIGSCLLELGRWEQAADAYQEAAAHATRLGDDRAAAVDNMPARLGAPGAGPLPGGVGGLHRGPGGVPEAGRTPHGGRDLASDRPGAPGGGAVRGRRAGLPTRPRPRSAAERPGRAGEHARPAGHCSTTVRGGWRKRSGSTGRRWTSTCAPATAPTKDKRRSNLADTLLRLGRHDQARTELHRALDCKKPYGHAAEPWKTWELLERLEHATGHPDAAHTARHQAIATYLAYRQAGGASQNTAIGLFDHVARAITEHTPDQAARDLAALLQPDTPPRITALVQVLQALLAGDPEPARTDHPDLDPRDVAELHLLLASLAEPPPDDNRRIARHRPSAPPRTTIDVSRTIGGGAVGGDPSRGRQIVVRGAGGRPGRTCAGTPSPTQNRRCASAYGAPGHPPTPRPSPPLSGKGSGWSVPSLQAPAAPTGTNPVQIHSTPHVT